MDLFEGYDVEFTVPFIANLLNDILMRNDGLRSVIKVGGEKRFCVQQVRAPVCPVCESFPTFDWQESELCHSNLTRGNLTFLIRTAVGGAVRSTGASMFGGALPEAVDQNWLGLML